jgi:hypothetical protein
VTGHHCKAKCQTNNHMARSTTKYSYGLACMYVAFHTGRNAPTQSEDSGLGCVQVTSTSAQVVQFNGAVADTLCARLKPAYASSSNGKSKRK